MKKLLINIFFFPQCATAFAGCLAKPGIAEFPAESGASSDGVALQILVIVIKIAIDVFILLRSICFCGLSAGNINDLWESLRLFFQISNKRLKLIG